ncbi:MAG: endonuclease/exonuclease/phosphatase family protein [Phycisphaerae bacterium]
MMTKPLNLALILTSLCSAPALAQLSADEAATKIRWQDAGKHIGQDCIVYGTVVRSKAITKWCFLNFDEDWRTTFTVAIPANCLKNFPKSPQVLYEQEKISVMGRVVEYKGKPEIIICSPDAITIGATFDEAAAGDGEPANAAEKKPPHRTFDGTCTIASFNILNLFDDVDDAYHSDEGTPPKPREEMERVAETLRRIDADVVALQEVETRGYLQRFIDVLAPDLGYEHVVLYEGNDRRGIDVAVLSRLPIGPVTSYRHLKFPGPNGKAMSFRRDLIQVRIEPPEAAAFYVFAIHLKSGRGDRAASTAIRQAEANQIRKIFDGILAHDPQAHFVLCGDYNDVADSEPVKTIVGQGPKALTSFTADLAPDTAISYNKEPYRSMIDFILASPAMAKRYVAKSYNILQGSVSTIGSDHNPVSAKFNLK